MWKAKLLLIEDNRDICQAFQILLTTRGYDVDCVSQANEARRMAACRKYDLLICDIGLPGLDGCDLFKELHARHGTRGIAMTGHAFEADIERYRAAGFSAEAVKPTSIDNLVAIIENVLADHLSTIFSATQIFSNDALQI